MVDFKVHLAKGLSAHEKASKAKDEVNNVLRELSNQVQEFTNGRVGIGLIEEPASLLRGAVDNIAGLTTGFSVTAPIRVQMNLVAYDISRGIRSAKRLAQWSQSTAGYPCSIRFRDSNHEAFDRKSLEAVLGDLLSYSETGRIIATISAKEPRVDEELGDV